MLPSGEEIKLYKKEYERNEDGALDKIMVDIMSNPDKLAILEPEVESDAAEQ
jgi:hypothetical protein